MASRQPLSKKPSICAPVAMSLIFGVAALMSPKRWAYSRGADGFRSVTNGRYVSIPRGELARILYRRIESRCETIFGDSVTEIDQGAHRVSVCFKREAQRDFDLVIGADGLHSVIRKLAFGKDSRFEKYLGYM